MGSPLAVFVALHFTIAAGQRTLQPNLTFVVVDNGPRIPFHSALVRQFPRAV